MHVLHKLRFLAILIFLFNQTILQASETKKDQATILALGMEMSNMRNMLAAYILTGAKISYKRPEERLKNGILHYENMLSTITKDYPHDEFIQASVKKSLHAWVNVKGAMELALAKTDLEKLKSAAIWIHGNIRTVIKEMAAMKGYLFKTSNIENKMALNASIEIAASAKRLSAHYMMDLWHLNDPTIEKHWKKGMKIYSDSIEVLQKSPFIKNKKFASNLKSVIKYHHYFEKMWQKSKIFSILIDKKTDIVFHKAKEMTEIILQSK